MGTEIRRVQRINDLISAINPGQFAIEAGVDADLGIKAAGYKDYDGNPYMFLVKDENAKVGELTADRISVSGANANQIVGQSLLLSASSGDVTANSAGGEFYLGDQYTAAASGNIPLAESGEGALDASFTAVSIIGALNELKTTGGVSLQGAYDLGNAIVTNSGVGAFDVSGTEDINLSSGGTMDLDADTFTLDVNGSVAQVLIQSSGTNGNIQVYNNNSNAGELQLHNQTNTAGQIELFEYLGTGLDSIYLWSQAGGVKIQALSELELVADIARLKGSGPTGDVEITSSGSSGAINIEALGGASGEITLKTNSSGSGDIKLNSFGGFYYNSDPGPDHNVQFTTPGDTQFTTNNFTIIPSANIFLNLPVVNPGVSGALWNNAGIVQVVP